MKKSNLKAKDLLMLYILSLITIALLSVSFLVYYQTKDFLMSNYALQKDQFEANIENTLWAVDSGFAMLEMNLRDEMEQKILEFMDEYEKAGGRPENISLDALKTKMGEQYDFVIIDRKTTIIKTTIPDTLNFNFMNASKDLGDRVNGMRTSGIIQHERFSTYSGTGYLSIFAYMPTPDQEYLLELSYTHPDLGDYVSQFKPVKMTSQLKKTYPEIVSVRVFDNFGTEFIEEGANRMPTKESLAIVDRARREKRFERSEGNLVKSYLYVDLKQKDNVLSDNSKIVEIVYDTTRFVLELRKILLMCFLTGFVVVAAMVFMIVKIKYDFDKIAKQQGELEKYNKNLEALVQDRTRELKEERELLRAALLSMGDGVITTDRNGNIRIVNASAEKLTGWTRQEVAGKPFNECFQFLYSGEGDQYQGPLDQVLRTGELVQDQNQLVLLSRGGREIPIENSASPIRDEEAVLTVRCLFSETIRKRRKSRRGLSI